MFSARTVRVVAVGIPSLAPVEANPVVDDAGSSKAAVGSSFHYGITDPALCHPASSTHVETCNTGGKWGIDMINQS